MALQETAREAQREGIKPAAALKSAVTEIARKEMEQALGEPVDLDELRAKPDKLDDTIDKLAEKFSDAWERLGALLAVFGIKLSEIEAERIPPSEPAALHNDTVEPPSPEWRTGEIAWKNSKRAKHAAETLSKHPDWLKFIERASQRHDVPVQTMIALIEIESGFNPDSPPTFKNKNGKIMRAKISRAEAHARGWKIEATAYGLTQGLKRSVQHYLQNRYKEFLAETGNRNNLPQNPDPESILYTPEVAIDFGAWHLRKIMNSTNNLVDNSKSEYPENFKLTSHSDTKYLWMSYNNGPLGYVRLRKYLEDKTDKNKDQLIWFQKRTRQTKDGPIFDALLREQTCNKANNIASAVEYTPAGPTAA